MYDIAGKLVKVLHDGITPVGVSQFNIDGHLLNDGVYYVSITGNGYTSFTSVNLIK